MTERKGRPWEGAYRGRGLVTAKTKKKAVLNVITVFLSGKGTEQIDGAVKSVLRREKE